MWWFLAAHANLSLLHRIFGTAAKPGWVLDGGCGTGGLLTTLTTNLPGSTVIGLDADVFACRRAAIKSGAPVCAGSIDALPFPDSSFTAILSADVLCHAGVDEIRALSECRRCLRDDGILVLNLPAYPWMLSRHDHAVANVRRYTRASLIGLLKQVGFSVRFTSYWNTILFPLMMLTRKLLPAGTGAPSDVRVYPAPIEAFCRLATGIETRFLRLGMGLPFGGSLLAVATKRVEQGASHA